MRTTVASFFIFFQELSNKKKLRFHIADHRRVSSAGHYSKWMWLLRIPHSWHDFGWQSSHSVDLAGWQAKMASIETWIPWRNAHKSHFRPTSPAFILIVTDRQTTRNPTSSYSSPPAPSVTTVTGESHLTRLSTFKLIKKSKRALMKDL